jgi:hypothetical protein
MRSVLSEVVYGQADSSYWQWRDIVAGLGTATRRSQVQADVRGFRQLIGSMN